MSDIVERLRERAYGPRFDVKPYNLLLDAAEAVEARDAEIQRLRAEVERLEKKADYAVRWANKAVEDVKAHDDGLIAAARAEAMERAAQIAEKEPAPFIDTVWGQCSGAIAAAIRAEASKKGGEG